MKEIEPVNDRFKTETDYLNYCLFKKESRYEGNLALKLHSMEIKISVHMGDRICSGENPMSVISF